MAVGNTFGATALSSYGGFWISYALILTPSLGIADAYSGTDVNSALGFFLTGWFIFTTILLLCTLRSTIMFFSLFFTLDLAFLFLFCSEYANNNGAASTAVSLQKAGGVFGMLAAFLAWYNAFAGIADSRSVPRPFLSLCPLFPQITTRINLQPKQFRQERKSLKSCLDYPVVLDPRKARRDSSISFCFSLSFSSDPTLIQKIRGKSCQD